MASPRAFISFEMEDRWARDFIAQHAKDKNNAIEFLDYSVKDPFESSWKTNCAKRIAQTKGTIVLIGITTYLSEAVLWEIQETARQEHPLFGIQINADKTHTVPKGVGAVVRWDFDAIVDALNRWT